MKKKMEIDIMSKEYKMYKSNSMKNKIQQKKPLVRLCQLSTSVVINEDIGPRIS